MWLLWPSKTSNRFSGVGVVVPGMKTFFNHSTAISSSVQPFSEAVNCHLSNLSNSSGNYCSWTDLPLKMTSGGRLEPVAETHSIKDVHTREPGCFFRIIDFSDLPRTRLLDP